jgi:hypothetical protein
MRCEYAHVLRESVAWAVRGLMESEVAAQVGAELGERARRAHRAARTAIASGAGTRGSGSLSWQSPS